MTTAGFGDWPTTGGGQKACILNQPDHDDESETGHGHIVALLDPARAQVYTVVLAALLIAIVACLGYLGSDLFAPTASDQSPSPSLPGLKDAARPPTVVAPGADGGTPIDTNEVAAEAARRAGALLDQDAPVASLSPPIPLPKPRPKVLRP